MGGIFAQGTLFQRGNEDGPPETFTTIADVNSISGPSMRGEVIDVTTHSSAGGFREKINGLIDPGELSFDINYDPGDVTHDGTVGLLFNFTDRTLLNWQLVFTDTGATVWRFSATVTSFEVTVATDDVIKASCTLTINGIPDFDAS